MPEKAATAFRTIGELSAETGIRQNVLRYWEGLFPQLRPLQRSGNRRYYRPEDVALVKRIRHLLDVEGYTVKGVGKLLGEAPALAPDPAPAAPPPDIAALRAIRDRLRAALAADVAA